MKNKKYRLNYHIMAPKNWINDPNGSVYYKGKYHIFYQHNPNKPVWGDICWGHVSSEDLVHWKYETNALMPSNEFDKDGCFSGTAAINPENGELVVAYTGHRWINQKEDFFEQKQCIAISSDGINFKKIKDKILDIKVPEDSTHHIRDPKIWHDGVEWNIILGNSANKKGRVILYKSKDLIEWKYIGVLAESNGELGYMWECPDLFSLNGKEVLIISPQGIKQKGEKYKNFNQSGYMVGKIVENKFNYKEFNELDYGHDFYAPQTFLDKDGRRILIAWMDMWESKMPSQEYGWAGALTIPREVSMKNDYIYLKPVEELKKLRVKKLENLKWDKDSLEFIFDIVGDTGVFELNLKSGNDEYALIQVDLDKRTIKVERCYLKKGMDKDYRIANIREKGNINLRVFLDASSIEIFVNDGEINLTSRIYPEKDNREIKCIKNENVEIKNIEIYELENIWNL